MHIPALAPFRHFDLEHLSGVEEKLFQQWLKRIYKEFTQRELNTFEHNLEVKQ